MRQFGQIGQMFDNRNLCAEQNRVHRALAAIHIVDIEAVDPDQRCAFVSQPGCGFAAEEWVLFEISVRPEFV